MAPTGLESLAPHRDNLWAVGKIGMTIPTAGLQSRGRGPPLSIGDRRILPRKHSTTHQTRCRRHKFPSTTKKRVLPNLPAGASGVVAWPDQPVRMWQTPPGPPFPEPPLGMPVPNPPNPPVVLPVDEDDVQTVRDLAAAYQRLTTEIGKVIVGQNKVIEQLLMSLFSRGHCLLVGVPGLAKTLLVSTVSKVLNLSFKRIQFTPDLMPSDITGTDILQDDPETGRRRFVFLPGPVFANMILADEINRTPPKTQAALLEAMQERQITAGAQTYRLPDPFFVLATQNPIEQEGTYPLPEAQLDRFMFHITVSYPSRAEEVEITQRTTSVQKP